MTPAATYWDRTRTISRRAVVRGSAISGLGLASAALIGCSSNKAPSAATTAAPSAAAAVPKVDPNSHLRIGLGSFGIQRLDPVTTDNGSRHRILTPMFDYMIRTKGRFNLGPSIVESWEATDNLTWVFKVRQGVKFHNDDPLTAEDVKFSLDRAGSKDSLRLELQNVLARTELVDANTVKITTKAPTISLPYSTSTFAPGHGMVMPKAYFEKVGGQKAFEAKPIGSGPFRLIKHVPDARFEYEAVENHWMQSPRFKKLTLTLVPEEGTRVAQLKAGDLDLTELGYDAAASLGKEFKSAVHDSVQISLVIPGAYEQKTAAMPTHDVRVRQALSLAINREEIGKTYFKGYFDPPMPPGVFKGTIGLNVDKWAERAKQAYRYDPAEAMKLLAAAGHKNFELKFFSHNLVPFLPDLANIIAGSWAKVGVKANLVPMDWATFSPIRASDQVLGNVTLLRTTADSVPRYVNDYLSTKAGWKGVLGSDPKWAKLLDEVLASTDASVRSKALETALDALLQGNTAIMIGDPGLIAAHSAKTSIDFTSQFFPSITTAAPWVMPA